MLRRVEAGCLALGKARQAQSSKVKAGWRAPGFALGTGAFCATDAQARAPREVNRRMTKTQLERAYRDACDALDEIGAILDSDVTEEEKLGRIENLVFEDVNEG